MSTEWDKFPKKMLEVKEISDTLIDIGQIERSILNKINNLLDKMESNPEMTLKELGD